MHIFGTNLFVLFVKAANSKESNNQLSLRSGTNPVNSKITSIQKYGEKLNQLAIQTEAKNLRKFHNSEITKIVKNLKLLGRTRIRKFPKFQKY